MPDWISLLIDLSFVPAVLLKSTVLLACAWLTHVMLHAQNPRWRVLLWRTVTIALVVLPVAELSLPNLTVELAREVSTPVASPIEPPFVPDTFAELPELETLLLPATVSSPANLHPETSFDVMKWLVAHKRAGAIALWSIVGIVLLMRSFGAWIRVRIEVAGSESAPANVTTLAASIAEVLGVPPKFQIRVIERIGSPFLTGIRTPMIVLSRRSFERDNAPRLPAILAHELSHAKTHDLLWMAGMRLVATLLWFHPLMWRVRAAHNAACEEVCDAVAATHVGSAEAYSKTLALEALALHGARPLGAGVPMIQRSEIIGRLKKIQRGIRANPLALRSVAVSLIVGTILLVTLGSLRLVTAQDDDVSDRYPHEIPVESYQQPWSTFSPGDGIEIIEVRGTAPEFEEGEDYFVRGRYTLLSREAAQLHVYATNGKVKSKQGSNVTKGEDGFTREFTLMKLGVPHVSFYPVDGGDGIGGTYFRRPDSYPPVDFGAALPPIELDASAGDTMVELQGLQVQLLAIVPAQEDVINANGSSVPVDSWGSSGEGIIREFRDPSGTTDVDDADRLGILFHLAPTRVSQGDYELRTAHLLAKGYRNSGNLRFGDAASREPMLSIFELSEFFWSAESREIQRSDVQADISYGPPLELFADIPSDARNTEIAMGAWKFAATVERLPSRQPSEALPANERPKVTLTFTAGGPLTNFEVVAIDNNSETIEAYNVEYLDKLVHKKEYTWEFGWPDPISNQSIQGFRLIGHRLQPIIWRNVALTEHE